MTTQQSSLTSEELFQSYMRAPRLAVPTTLIFVVVIIAMLVTWYSALNGFIELWVGSIINGLLSYGLFSVIHDGAHRSLSSNSLLNEGIGSVALVFLFPYAPMSLLRWVHNQHHIHANGPQDPDIFEHESPWWQVPLRWTFFDGYYIYYFLKHGKKVMKKHARSLIIFYSLLLVVFTLSLIAGFGYELLMLWFIPTRIALFLIAVVFVILPHHPAIVSQEEDPYMATTMRMGWEWLLTPLLVYQNYHLIHHLYPTIPFYKMHDIWFLKYDELNQHNISFQKPFALAPANIESHKNFHSRQTD
jgi:beta-carotene hydroxylase